MINVFTTMISHITLSLFCFNFWCCSRTFLSIIGGVIAGIWGFTGFTGFVFYFVVMLAASFGLAAKAKFSADSYFDSWNRVLLDGILGGLMSFVLFWTFAYDIVHIF
ncbi:ER membrane protein complex subunit 6 [Rhynchospora pubera]|uniref:ER membrane protein complex subunit 6 n=1 Tax=Rhynchospora pubera TaxID=906938 RepID=A0AAV8HY39_9POAL|nr:ER membrane protein complex subunit 6 [Rhynchospora pubera]